MHPVQTRIQAGACQIRVGRATLRVVSVESYCGVAECESPTRQGRVRCDFHEKRHQRGQSLTAPKVERLSPKERLLEAAYRFAESSAEDDAAYERNARELLKAARQLVPSVHGELVRQGQSRARRAGVHCGRRPALTAEEALALVKQHGTPGKAAEAARVSRWALYRALARVAKVVVSQRVA